LGQGESLATAADLLVFRQSLGRETGDGQSRQTHVRGGRSNLANPGVEAQSHRHIAAARLSTAPAAACPHSKGQREVEAAGYSDDARPRHAGVASAGVVAGRGNDGGQNSYGFRSGRGTADAIGQSFLMLSRKDSATWVLEGDIRGCFDNISHEWLLAHVPTDKEVLHKWLKAGFMENRTLFPTEAGTPQGGIISPTLANLTLDGLEPLLKQHFPRKYADGKTICPKIHLIRYADDFIITGTTKDVLENEVRPLVEQFLRDRGLQFSPEKTCVTHIEQGFDFLGQNLRKFDGKLIIQPAQKNTRVFLDKARKLIRQNRGTSQTDLIRQLNPVIRGWVTVSAQVSLSLRSLVLMVTAVMIIFMLLTTVELVTAPAQRQCYISITQGQRHIKILRYADLLAYYA
jgi:group II intron reverse transcriptase/maturase